MFSSLLEIPNWVLRLLIVVVMIGFQIPENMAGYRLTNQAL